MDIISGCGQGPGKGNEDGNRRDRMKREGFIWLMASDE